MRPDAASLLRNDARALNGLCALRPLGRLRAARTPILAKKLLVRNVLKFRISHFVTWLRIIRAKTRMIEQIDCLRCEIEQQYLESVLRR